ncbi:MULTISPECIES: hypothetical protein, partial [unclassified Moorena]|uniref:hypothetical protein n=1 Tax=unclassified Moorena TaxID=2683338 RepID=UPI0025E2BB9B
MTYSRRCPNGTTRASCQHQVSLSGFARRYANGYSAIKLSRGVAPADSSPKPDVKVSPHPAPRDGISCQWYLYIRMDF